MKMHQRVIFFLFVIPICAFAGWQVTAPQATIPREPFFQTQMVPKVVPPSAYVSSNPFPSKLAKNLGQPASVYAISISGSLKDNLERIMGRYHWHVIWKAPYDFNFDGRVCGSSLPNVVEKLLQPFPLQAVMYMSNRTVAIIPRQKIGRD